MGLKLSSFYYDCLLPEFVDPCFTRGKPIRGPCYVKAKVINLENAHVNENKENMLNEKKSARGLTGC